jgi:hypothetical protein
MAMKAAKFRNEAEFVKHDIFPKKTIPIAVRATGKDPPGIDIHSRLPCLAAACQGISANKPAGDEIIHPSREILIYNNISPHN